jgi:4-hydroxy-2-oxoheptanedioate aldolase
MIPPNPIETAPLSQRFARQKPPFQPSENPTFGHSIPLLLIGGQKASQNAPASRAKNRTPICDALEYVPCSPFCNRHPALCDGERTARFHRDDSRRDGSRGVNNMHNSFKTALVEHDSPQIGLWLALGNPYTAELCATAGYDWLLIDGEHGPNDLRSTLAQLQAVAPYSAHAIVRPPIGDVNLIKQLLDTGVQTLLIPMVETAEQAALMVAATRYPTAGIRGVGSSLARASRWNATQSYLHEANAAMCVLVQVESPAALENLDAIAAVEGVDGVFIGPADLAASLGHLGNPGHPTVQTAIQDAIRRIKLAGKPPGILALDEAVAKRYIEWGCRFVAVGADALLLAAAVRGLAQKFKAPPT